MNKKELLLLLIVIALPAAVFFQQYNYCTPVQNQQNQLLGNNSFSEEIFFCPEENCAEKLVSKISQAEKSIHVAIYSFTHDEISDALINAKKRGLEVMILMEKQQSGVQGNDYEKLLQNGIETKFMDNPKGVMHNKFSIIDSKIVSTGSFNYTKNADEHNNENIVFLDNPETVSAFEKEFQRLWEKN